MPSYANGYIPDSLLITFNVGYSAGEGQWKHQLSPATYAKHLALLALARKNTGRTLAISAGWGAYRPYAAQVYARKVHGNGAASPGTSSHGGFWERQQTLAIDYGNWSYVYNGSRDAFYRDARAVGFEPGLISPQRGYPDEPWHVVDKNPWAAAAAAGTPTGAVTSPTPERKKRNMGDFILLVTKDNHGGVRRYLIDARLEAHREISQYKYDVYKNAGTPEVYGFQPVDKLGEWSKTF